MTLLLDTHVWIWSLLDPGRLGAKTTRLLEDRGNELWLSPISVWECLVLAGKGRLAIEQDPGEWVEEALRRAPMKEAPLTHEIALDSRRVDLPHQDPADRLLAATARVMGLKLVTADDRLIKSPAVPTISLR
ncbi:MAG: type II toxin-antitoxin system VapC family toxin [Candidatus Coatesbacteria bacterium]